MRLKLALVAFGFACAFLPSCSTKSSPKGKDSSSQSSSVTPVKVESVAKKDVPVFVSGPGATKALETQKLVAPFAGTLISFDVADGDRVKAHQAVAELASENSMAEVTGAQEMVKTARTPQERADARRALDLAKRNLVKRTLRASEAGIVASHSVDEGAVVAKDQALAEIAATDSIAFVAQIDQSELDRVQPGQPVWIDLAGGTTPVHGAVHAVLPTGQSSDLTSPVRIDFAKDETPTLGLFGTARIRVALHQNAVVVPDNALVRDDVQGTIKIAVVSRGDRANWVKVKTGPSSNGWTEIISPALSSGENVVVEGQVGLAEDGRVKVSP